MCRTRYSSSVNRHGSLIIGELCKCACAEDAAKEGWESCSSLNSWASSPRSAMSSSVSVLVPVSLGPVQPDIPVSSCCGLAADVGHKLLLLLFINWHLFYILKKCYWWESSKQVVWYNGGVVNKLPSPQTFRCTKSTNLFWKQTRFSVLLLAYTPEVKLQDVILHAAVLHPLNSIAILPITAEGSNATPAFLHLDPLVHDISHMLCAVWVIWKNGWYLKMLYGPRECGILKKLLEDLENNFLLACGVLVDNIKQFSLKEWSFPHGAAIHRRLSS